MLDGPRKFTLLNVSNNRIESIHFLSEGKYLAVLTAHDADNNLSDISELQSLTKSRPLFLGDNETIPKKISGASQSQNKRRFSQPMVEIIIEE